MPIDDDVLAEARRLVQSDIEDGFKGVLTAREEAAFAVGLDESDRNDFDAIATSDTLVVVPWRYPCTHVGTFLDVPKTNEKLELRGTTFVDVRGPSSAWTYYRYIDFMGALHQLGAAYDVRPVRADTLAVEE
jgi:hypothetical protein